MNSFLLDEINTKLIEYEAFFGSIEIFKSLRIGKAKIESRIWSYMVDGKNAELIQLIERDKIDGNIKEKIGKSIKCHHNEIATYFKSNESAQSVSSRNSIKNFKKKKNTIFKTKIFNKRLIK